MTKLGQSALRLAARFIEAKPSGFHGLGMSPELMRLPGPQFSDKKPVPFDDIEEAVDYLEEIKPGLLVAYSRGAVVAMLALRQSGVKPKVIWVAPAWQRGWAKVAPPSVPGVILHGDQDNAVPVQNSCELALATGIPLRIVPDRNHINILKDKTNPSAGIPVPKDKVNECARTLPDWGSGKGSPADIALQQAFTDSLTARVAARFRQANTLDASYRTFKDAYDTFKVAFQSMDPRNQWEGLSDPWTNLIVAGHPYAKAVLRHKATPPGLEKKLEMAARLVMATRGAPHDLASWFRKNKTRFDLLIDAYDWEGKTEGTSALFKVGPFTVHNTLALSDDELSAIKNTLATAAKLARKTGLPDFHKAIYGDVFITGKLDSQSHNKSIAVYWHEDDDIFLRPVTRIGLGPVANLIHELGHRYWRRFADKAKKSAWYKYHRTHPAVPTPYARTNAEERFCETVALYATGKLTGRFPAEYEAVWLDSTALVASRFRQAHVQPVIDIAMTAHGLESALVDKLTNKALALVEAEEIKPRGHWLVQAGRVFGPHRGEGYGTEAYVAAIKYATETGGGLVQTDKASPDALKVRARVRQRGIKVERGYLYKTHDGTTEFGFDPPPDAVGVEGAVVMTGRKPPAYPQLRSASGRKARSASVDRVAAKALDLTGDRPITKTEAKKLKRWWEANGYSVTLTKAPRGLFYLHGSKR